MRQISAFACIAPTCMKLFGATLLVACLNISSPVPAADAAKIDYSQRNLSFAPAASVAPKINAPKVNNSLDRRHVTPVAIDREAAAIGNRRAPVDVATTHPKTLIEKEARQPEVRARALSLFDHRQPRLQPAAQLKKLPTVSRYQDGLNAAGVMGVSRFRALDPTTSAQLNRFVFRKNETRRPTISVMRAAGGFSP